MPIHTTSPHPSVPSTKYVHTGIGGAGNYHRYEPTTSSTSLNPIRSTTTAVPTYPSAQPRNFTTGRGGAGNRCQPSERAIFSFDEELERVRKDSEGMAPVYHIGRGGVGNLLDERRMSAAAERAGSISSGGSGESYRGVGEKSKEWLRERLSRGSAS
ncbi:hypothetical protein MMC11_008932 [Xylographa trunciseda]|nr:hypothetical protein [Xylographa trunciseda]